MTAVLAAAAAALTLLTGQPTPPPVLIGGGALPSDRAWSVERPSRGAHAGVFRAASTIPGWLRPWAGCVLWRESKGTLDRPGSGAGAINTEGSSAQGRWQLLDRAWRVNGGIHYVVARRLKAFGMPAEQLRQVRQYAHTTPIHRWPAPLQDIAFIQIVTEGGARHWDGPGCHHLLPAGAR